jgi:hypothetical protein
MRKHMPEKIIGIPRKVKISIQEMQSLQEKG